MKIEVSKKTWGAEVVFDDINTTINLDVNDSKEALALSNTLLNAAHDLAYIFDFDLEREE